MTTDEFVWPRHLIGLMPRPAGVTEAEHEAWKKRELEFTERFEARHPEIAVEARRSP